MRPTDLQSRSPKEATPGPYYPLVTKDGRSIDSGSIKGKPTFGSEERFREYRQIARKTGALVSPSSYSPNTPDISKKKIPGGNAYNPLALSQGVSHNGYCFIGNHLLYEPKEKAMNPNSLRGSSVEGLRSISKQLSYAGVTNEQDKDEQLYRNYLHQNRKFFGK